MMEKLAQPGEGGEGARPPHFTLSTITYKVVVYAPAERAGILPQFLLYPYMYSTPAPFPLLSLLPLLCDFHPYLQPPL
jgi:hypothetical protein